eukprot:scaffold310_cov168-Amphora_coffeaeformis.AAC.37
MKNDNNGGGLACAVSVNVAAPPQVLWEVLLDMEHHVDFIQGVHSMERIGKREVPLCVGSVWHETRKIKGKGIKKKTITQRKTIISLDNDDEHFPKSLGFSMATVETHPKKPNKDYSNTYTFTVYSSTDNNVEAGDLPSSTLIMSIAFCARRSLVMFLLRTV